MRFTTFAMAALLLLGSLGCQSGPDHYARALAVEREIKRQAPDAGYEDPRYIVVLKELRRVPRAHKHRADADTLAQTIRDGRRVAAAKKYPGAATLPARLTDDAPEAAPTEDGPSADIAPLEVVLYSTSWCGYCKRARNWFTKNGIPFVEKDIEKDRAAHAEYQRIGGGYGGVPLISVNGAVIRGFDQRAVQRAIQKVTAGTQPG